MGQLRSMWNAGQVTGDTLYCEEGYESWLQLRALANELESRLAPPPLPQTPAPSRTGRRRNALQFIGIVGGLIALIALLVVVFSLGEKRAAQAPFAPPQTAPQPSSRPAATDSQVVTAEYARLVNAFADKHDMTVEEVMRWDYVLGRGGLTLGDFDQTLSKLGQSRDKAVGYHVETTKHNLGSRRLVAGDAQFPQNPTLTKEEESMIKLLKAVGY